MGSNNESCWKIPLKLPPKKVIQKIIALGFVPLAGVQIPYRNVCERERTQQLINEHPKLEELFDYFGKTRLNGN